MGVEGGFAQDLLRPPGDGSLKEFLTWVSRWRALPLASPSFRGEAVSLLNRARARALVRVADSLVGPIVGLSALGERESGLRGTRLAHLSARTASFRAALHLAAHRLPHGERVVAIDRHYLVVEGEGKRKRLGWRVGDLAAGPLGAAVPLPVALPKQMDLSELDLDDLEWERLFLLAVRTPGERVRSPFWARTLLDASLLLAAEGVRALEEKGGKGLVYATYRFIRSRRTLWEVLPRRVKRADKLAGRLRRMAEG